MAKIKGWKKSFDGWSFDGWSSPKYYTIVYTSDKDKMVEISKDFDWGDVWTVTYYDKRGEPINSITYKQKRYALARAMSYMRSYPNG